MKIQHASQPGWEDTDEEGVIQPSEVEGIEHIVSEGEIPDRTQPNTWEKAQRGAIVVLASETVIQPDFASANNFRLPLDTNALLDNPKHAEPGQSGVIAVTQADEGATHTLVFGSAFVFPRGAAPMLTNRLGATDYLSYYVGTENRIAIFFKGDIK
jgi:hypothetical protein